MAMGFQLCYQNKPPGKSTPRDPVVARRIPWPPTSTVYLGIAGDLCIVSPQKLIEITRYPSPGLLALPSTFPAPAMLG